MEKRVPAQYKGMDAGFYVKTKCPLHLQKRASDTHCRLFTKKDEDRPVLLSNILEKTVLGKERETVAWYNKKSNE